jgi:hypothetical protein
LVTSILSSLGVWLNFYNFRFLSLLKMGNILIFLPRHGWTQRTNILNLKSIPVSNYFELHSIPGFHQALSSIPGFHQALSCIPIGFAKHYRLSLCFTKHYRLSLCFTKHYRLSLGFTKHYRYSRWWAANRLINKVHSFSLCVEVLRLKQVELREIERWFLARISVNSSQMNHQTATETYLYTWHQFCTYLHMYLCSLAPKPVTPTPQPPVPQPPAPVKPSKPGQCCTILI